MIDYMIYKAYSTYILLILFISILIMNSEYVFYYNLININQYNDLEFKTRTSS